MRYLFVSILLFSFFVSCGKINEEIAFDEIRKLEYTRNAVTEKLISFLNHKNPNIRLRAVKALGRIQDTSKVVLIANRLKDENEEIRRAAAFALGQLFSPVAENHLIDALQLDLSESVRIKIVEALGKSGTEKCFNILKDFLESDKHSYEISATIANGILAYRGYPPYTNSFSLEVLLNAAKTSEVKWRAGYSLFRIGSPGSFKNVYEEINNPESALVRYFGIRALTTMLTVMKSQEFQEFKNHPRMAEGLQLSQSSEFYDTVAKMLNDEAWYVRVATLQLIGTLGKGFFQDEVINTIEDDHPYVRLTAIQTLSNFKGRLPHSHLSQIYNSDMHWQIKGEALLTLTELNTSSALNLVETDLAELSWPENYYLIKSLEKMSGDNYRKKTTDLLMQLANGQEKAQQTLALEALVNRTEVPIKFMLEKLATVDPAMTTIVSTHIAFKKAAQAVKPLIDVYRNFTAPKDIEAMQGIIVALDSIRSPRAIPFLEEQLQNPYPPIQEHSQTALMHITGESVEIPEVDHKYLTKWKFDVIDSLRESGNSPNPQVKLQTTKGNIVLELFMNKAPVTVANFISLVQRGFYNGVYFHRVIPGFVIQGGDPRGDGWGGPGYSIPCEYNDNFYDRGTVGMAHAGKDTGGSQFFITHLPQPHLNGRHTAFGKVIEGMDVVDQIMMFDKIENVRLLTKETIASN